MPWAERTEDEKVSWRTGSDDRQRGHFFQKASDEILPVSRFLQHCDLQVSLVRFPLDNQPGCDAILDLGSRELKVEVTRADRTLFGRMSSLSKDGQNGESFTFESKANEVADGVRNAIMKKQLKYSKTNCFPDVLLLYMRMPGTFNRHEWDQLKPKVESISLETDMKYIYLLHDCASAELLRVAS